MNRRDLIKASAALNFVGWRSTHAAPAPTGHAYIDASAVGTGHSGTFSDPYSTADALVYFSLLSGDLGNRRIRFKAGTTFVGQVTIQGCDNYFLGPYGTGAAPIISNHVDISGLTWVPDDGARGGPAADVYYLPVSGGGSTWSAGETAVIVDDGTGAKQCEYRQSYAELIGPLYPCNEIAYPSGWPFLQWWDTSTSPNRMWIRGPAGWDPNAMTVRHPVASQGVMHLAYGSGVVVSNLDLQSGAYGNFLAENVSGLLLDHVDSQNCGGNALAAQNCFNIVGPSKSERATDVMLRSCRAFRSIQRGSSHGLEISWLRNVTIDDFEARDIRLHGIEFWSSNSDVTVRRMRARQTATLMQFQTGDPAEADTLHDNILVQNCECVQRTSYLHHSTDASNIAGGNGIVVCDFSRNRKFVSDLRIYGNSFDLDGAYFLYAYIDGNAASGLGNNAVTFKGNVCRLSQVTGTQTGGLYCCAVDSAATEWTMDRNVYQFAVNPTNKLAVADAYTSSLAGYQGLWDANGPSTNENDSIVAGAAALLYSVPGGSLQTADLSLINEVVAAVGRGDPGDGYTPATDILGVNRDGSPDAGAYEYVAGSDSTPAPVDFQDQANAEINQDITSAAITITGLTRGATVSVANGSYEIGGSGDFVTSTGTIYNGQSLRARVHSPSSAITPATVVVTVGGTPISFTATTGSGGGAGPAQFTFTDFAAADFSTTYISLPVTLIGLTGTAPISVSGDPSALYSVNSTTVFTSSPGTVVNGDVIRAAVTTGTNGATPYDAVVTINSVVGTYRVTTGEPP